MRQKNKIKFAMLGILVLFVVACGAEEPFYYENVSKTETGISGTDVTDTVSDPSEMGVGDVMFFRFGGNNGTAEVDFSGVEESAAFYLGIASISEYPGSQGATIMDVNTPLEDNSKGAVVDHYAWLGDTTPEEGFAQKLHDEELKLSLSADLAVADSAEDSSMKFSKAAITNSQFKRFKVLSSVSSLYSATEVTGELYYEGENVKCYVDMEVAQNNPDDLSEDDVDGLCERYDEQVAIERDLFGSESDVDVDGKVAILFTPQVNRLGGMAGGVITGFFFAKDLYAKTSANPVSNEMEIIYAVVPDSEGVYGSTLPKTFVIENYLTAVFAHELQHLISFNQHVFVNNGEAESGAINEAISHLTEDYVGFGQENPSRYELFLDSPSYYSVIGGESPGLGDRGASFLFLRYLYEQHYDGKKFLKSLVSTHLTGTENLVEAYGDGAEDISDLSDMVGHWMATLLISGSGLSSDERFNYKERVFNGDTNRWQGVCLHCNAEDGRGTVLTGVAINSFSSGAKTNLEYGAVKFYELDSPNAAFEFYGGSNGDFTAVLVRKQ